MGASFRLRKLDFNQAINYLSESFLYGVSRHADLFLHDISPVFDHLFSAHRSGFRVAREAAASRNNEHHDGIVRLRTERFPEIQTISVPEGELVIPIKKIAKNY